MTITDDATTDVDTTRADFIAGLRDLADFYEAAPDFPVPFEAKFDDSSQYHLHGIDGPDQLATLTRMLGGRRTKDADEHAVHITRRFGPGVVVELYVSREEVCERRVVGTETVEVPDPDAPKITIEREIVEWVCAPVLGGGA